MSDKSGLIGIDWGTTRLRAFRIDRDGRMLECRSNDRGVGVIREGQFEEALEAIIAGWPSGVPILMCGMVGSRQGWQEVPYHPCPVHEIDLAGHLCPLETRSGRSWIIGGVRTQDDVMRGEETQIVGAATGSGIELIIMPGTHSKWAMVRAGRVDRFRTSMTGEVYALLAQHSILGRLMASGAPQHDEASFRDGVRLAVEERGLLHALFSVRTQGLFAKRAPEHLASYLSGILIGSEVSTETRCHDPALAVTLIATAQLGRLYQAALAQVGRPDVRFVDAEEAVVQGLWRIWQLRGRNV